MSEVRVYVVNRPVVLGKTGDDEELRVLDDYIAEVGEAVGVDGF